MAVIVPVSRDVSAHVITSAPVSRSSSVERRRRRYVWAMMARVACFIAMVAAPVPFWMRLVFAGVAIVIPYVAVVAANAWSRSHGDP